MVPMARWLRPAGCKLWARPQNDAAAGAAAKAMRTRVAVSLIRQSSAGQLGARIGARMIEVLGVFAATGDRRHSCPLHVGDAVDDQQRVAPVGDDLGQVFSKAELPFGRRQHHVKSEWQCAKMHLAH